MTKLKHLHEKWSNDASYRIAYDALEEEFALAGAIAEARARAGLTQAEVAELRRQLISCEITQTGQYHLR